MKAAIVKLTYDALAAILKLPTNLSIDKVGEMQVDTANRQVSVMINGDGLPDECSVVAGQRVRTILLKFTGEKCDGYDVLM